MYRKKIAAGNWKMHKTVADGTALAEHLASNWNGQHAEMVVAPPFIHLPRILEITNDSSIKVAAQNCHAQKEGAFTGEVSAYMLADLGVDYVILGHSERREYFHESNALLREKVEAVLDEGLECIFCCGEPLDVRQDEAQEAYVSTQLLESLFHLEPEQMGRIVIAYEPIWAIGTGLTASPEQAQSMHAFIRGMLIERYGEDLASSISILYGGSVKPGNAQELFSQPDVDGGLVGGASLKGPDFIAIGDALDTHAS